MTHLLQVDGANVRAADAGHLIAPLLPLLRVVMSPQRDAVASGVVMKAAQDLLPLAVVTCLLGVAAPLKKALGIVTRVLLQHRLPVMASTGPVPSGEVVSKRLTTITVQHTDMTWMSSS